MAINGGGVVSNDNLSSKSFPMAILDSDVTTESRIMEERTALQDKANAYAWLKNENKVDLSTIAETAKVVNQTMHDLAADRITLDEFLLLDSLIVSMGCGAPLGVVLLKATEIADEMEGNVVHADELYDMRVKWFKDEGNIEEFRRWLDIIREAQISLNMSGVKKLVEQIFPDLDVEMLLESVTGVPVSSGGGSAPITGVRRQSNVKKASGIKSSLLWTTAALTTVAIVVAGVLFAKNKEDESPKDIVMPPADVPKLVFTPPSDVGPSIPIVDDGVSASVRVTPTDKPATETPVATQTVPPTVTAEATKEPLRACEIVEPVDYGELKTFLKDNKIIFNESYDEDDESMEGKSSIINLSINLRLNDDATPELIEELQKMLSGGIQEKNGSPVITFINLPRDISGNQAEFIVDQFTSDSFHGIAVIGGQGDVEPYDIQHSQPLADKLGWPRQSSLGFAFGVYRGPGLSTAEIEFIYEFASYSIKPDREVYVNFSGIVNEGDGSSATRGSDDITLGNLYPNHNTELVSLALIPIEAFPMMTDVLALERLTNLHTDRWVYRENTAITNAALHLNPPGDDCVLTQ